MLPGNNLQDNWFMGPQPVEVPTLKELLDRVVGFNSDYRLTDIKGRCIKIRMGENKGVIVFEV